MAVMLERKREARESPAREWPTDVDDAIIHLLSELSEFDAATLAFEPLTLKRAVREYQAMEEPTGSLDSEQAAELATLNERRNRLAAITWSKLTIQEQSQWLSQTPRPLELKYLLEYLPV